MSNFASMKAFRSSFHGIITFEKLAILRTLCISFRIPTRKPSLKIFSFLNLSGENLLSKLVALYVNPIRARTSI